MKALTVGMTTSIPGSSSDIPTLLVQETSLGAETGRSNKRKTRSQKVCQPCRLSKVKCSFGFPCQTCVDRGQSNLCHYLDDETTKRVHLGTSPIDTDSPSSQKNDIADIRQHLTALTRLFQELQRDVRRLRTELSGTTKNISSTPEPESSITAPAVDVIQGISADNRLDGGSVFLGGNSVPAMVMALANKLPPDSTAQTVIGKSILPIFCLDNESATYPFVDLWGIPHGSFRRIELLCQLLPTTDAECIEIFAQYRDTAHVIYPAVVDISELESDLFDFLRTRSTDSLTERAEDSVEHRVYNKDLHWLGLLFATFASGIQGCAIPRKERQMRSQVYVCCAYECLRIVNYLSRATLIDIQNLLVLGNVISNNMNAGVAWSLLGLTTRLAQTRGLHNDPPSLDLSIEQTTRSNIWWQIAWQDSLLSVTFDRASSASTLNHRRLSKSVRELSYVDSMRRLCLTGLEIVQSRAILQSTLDRLVRITEWRDQIQADMEHVLPHLKEVVKCRSMREQLEFWNLYMHRSYIMSELCRPLLDIRQYPHTHEDLTKSFRRLCIDSLANTVEAFLGLQNITRFATQSWAAVHRSLSSALLLAILGEASQSDRVSGLLARLVSVVSDVISSLDPGELSAPLTRAHGALQKLLEHPSAPRYSETQNSFDLFTPGALSSHDYSKTSSLSGTEGTMSSESLFWDSEHSPSSMLNNIFWGSSNSPSNHEQ